MMRRFLTISAVLVAAALSSQQAAAADVISIPTSTDAELPVHDSSAFDWDGFYAGVYGTVQDAPVSGTQFGGGLNVGVNAQLDFYLVGAEVSVQGLSDDGVGETIYGQILGRAGLIVTDDVAIYAAGGYGIDLGPPDEQDILAGGGVEMAITDSVSLRAQYLHGFPTLGGNPKNQFTLGANYHF